MRDACSVTRKRRPTLKSLMTRLMAIPVIAAALTLGVTLSQPPAMATSASGHHAAARTGERSGSVSGVRYITTRTGARRSCPWKFDWHASNIDGYTEVDWETNPCQFYIQNEGEFEGIYHNRYWRYSGYCKRLELQCRSNADSVLDSTNAGGRRIKFNNWYPWRIYWGKP